MLVFLEDRGVLYEPYQVEMPGACVESVREIREMLTITLRSGGLGEQIEADLRTFRGSSTAFIRRVETLTNSDSQAQRDDDWANRKLQEWMFSGDARSWVFNQALGAFRAEAGMVIAKLGVAYGIDVEPPLDSTLPSHPE